MYSILFIYIDSLFIHCICMYYITVGVRFKDMPIFSAQFQTGTSHVLVGGRRPFFYSYDLEAGVVSKIQGIYGKNLKTHEKVYCDNSVVYNNIVKC